MKRSSMKKLLSVICVSVLFAAMALSFTGCGSKEEVPATTAGSSAVQFTPIGEGSKTFYFIAVDLDGAETGFEVHTDAQYVGEALVAHGLIAGDSGDYGLYVKTVNGITLDWDKDAKYWSLLINGEYAMTGADMTEIEEGTTYTFLPAE